MAVSAVLAAVLGVAAAGCARTGADASTGTAAAMRSRDGEFHHVPIVSVAGGVSSLSQVLATRPTLVSFWAPWCAPCVRELPDLERLSQAMAPCGATVVGIAVGETPAAVLEFTRARQLSYPQFADQGFLLADALGQRRIPVTMVFDAAQRVVFVGDALDGRALAALAAALPSGQDVPGCAGTLQALNK